MTDAYCAIEMSIFCGLCFSHSHHLPLVDGGRFEVFVVHYFLNPSKLPQREARNQNGERREKASVYSTDRSAWFRLGRS